MIENLYFIVNLPEQAIDAIMEHVVGDSSTQRKSLDKSKSLVKLPIQLSIDIKAGVSEAPAPLKKYTAYNHSEIKEILNSEEWTVKEEI